MMNAIKTTIYLALILGGMFILVPGAILVSESELPYEIEWSGLFGIVPITLGLITFFHCGIDFVKTGRGTPNPADPPKNLVSSRLYGIVRNPFYVGGVLILIGESILFSSLGLFAYAAILWLVAHLGVVLFEEPTLQRKFGVSYEKYRDEVPRWIPKFSKLIIGTLKTRNDRKSD